MANHRQIDLFKAQLNREIQENIDVTSKLARSSGLIIEAAALILTCLRAGGKLITFGNGGSAAEAQHLVAELVGRYRVDRQALAAVALTTESASITAIANDYGFEQIFSRQLQAIAKPGDVAFAISTSGNSSNVIVALQTARTLGLITIGMTGRSGGKLANLVDVCLSAPSDCTARIQEVHALVVHLICGLIEDSFAHSSERETQLNAPAGEVR